MNNGLTDRICPVADLELLFTCKRAASAVPMSVPRGDINRNRALLRNDKRNDPVRRVARFVLSKRVDQPRDDFSFYAQGGF